MRSFLILSLFSFSIFAAEMNTLSDEQKSEGWQLLFDGKTTNGWVNYQSDKLNPLWVAEDGCLKLVKKGGGHMHSTSSFKDFELKLQWKISAGGNSGVFLRVTPKSASGSPEMQVLDNEKNGNGKDPKTSAGALYGIIAAPKGAVKAQGEWNQVHIIAKGKHYQFFLNGVKTADFDIDSEEFQKLKSQGKMAKKKTYGSNTEGHIGLQDHGKEVCFRNIMIKEL
ncbi:probable secreted glycosyl hydrolase [Lentisphaera araneosa HTCC2155]|uniref:Probable secreted glycosyl hydrolase n=1 Tax=Lentisphaera araneosa HTCC2155 TaxID=313628 RepID=A6DJ51_9BACT|nr:DUF1080 domain-containing protein [Lentisphaera araneosa]EDM28487.1 probable secreted glycosyl hydrolase [Lentisphaera araneosa HTCC2155]